MLLARFGPGRTIDPDKSTFDYELEAVVDGEREVRLDVTDSKGALYASFGRFGAREPDPADLARVRDALLALAEATTPADFEARFFEPSVRRYGCAGGAPWVGTKKHGGPSCQPIAGSAFDRARARDLVVIDVPALARAAAPPADDAVTDAEVEAYYARTATPGFPPLATIREHVVRAMLLERARAASPSSVEGRVESRAIARVVFDLAELALYDFVPLARAFTSPYPPDDLDATRGLRKLRRLRARVVDGALAAAAADPGLARELVADLDRCVALLAEAARARAPFRVARRVL